MKTFSEIAGTGRIVKAKEDISLLNPIVSMVNYNGRVMIATTTELYMINPEGKLELAEFEYEER